MYHIRISCLRESSPAFPDLLRTNHDHSACAILMGTHTRMLRGLPLLLVVFVLREYTSYCHLSSNSKLCIWQAPMGQTRAHAASTANASAGCERMCPSPMGHHCPFHYTSYLRLLIGMSFMKLYDERHVYIMILRSSLSADDDVRDYL